MKKEIKESTKDWEEFKKRMKNTKTTNVTEISTEKSISSNDLNLQHFFDDMEMLGTQINNRNIRKPNFYYADLTTTNYLLWLILGELKISNQNKGVENANSNN